MKLSDLEIYLIFFIDCHDLMTFSVQLTFSELPHTSYFTWLGDSTDTHLNKYRGRACSLNQSQSSKYKGVWVIFLVITNHMAYSPQNKILTLGSLVFHWAACEPEHGNICQGGRAFFLFNLHTQFFLSNVWFKSRSKRLKLQIWSSL